MFQISEYIKTLEKLYEEYERAQKIIAEQREVTKELKNEMIQIMNDQGVDSAIVSGLEIDAVELLIESTEREVLNKKMVAETIGVPQKELSKIEQWVALTNEGKITPDIIESAKFIEQGERFSTKPYKGEAEE